MRLQNFGLIEVIKNWKVGSTMRPLIILSGLMGLLPLLCLSLASHAADAAELSSPPPSMSGAADRYVQSEVKCSDGRAITTNRTRSHGAFEQISFEPILVTIGLKQIPISCSEGNFSLAGKRLTNIEVFTYAMTSRDDLGVRDDWVLILNRVDQPATYVPGFSSEATCKQAVSTWEDRGRSEGGPQGHAVCVKR